MWARRAGLPSKYHRLCWTARCPLGADGQLGDGEPHAGASAPVGVAAHGERVVAMAVGAGHTCGLLHPGAVRCWGANDYGQVGSETGAQSVLAATTAAGLSQHVRDLSASHLHTCAVLQTGHVMCWGDNGYQQMVPQGSHELQGTPARVDSLPNRAVQVSAGGSHSCARLDTHGISCWGAGGDGQLGDGTIHDVPSTAVNVIGF